MDFYKSEMDFIDDYRFIETDFAPKSMSSFVLDFSTSLNKKSHITKSITIFPNPTSDIIYFFGSDAEIQCSVFSISGKKLFEQTVPHEKSLIYQN